MAAAQRLADDDLAAVYSSDLERALHTARAIAELHDLEVRPDPAFREIDQGEWTGLPTEEIRARWPELWGGARHYSARPGGESPSEVRTRALGGLVRVVAQHPTGTVVVVSHGGTIRWIGAEALGYDDHESARMEGLANGAMVVLEAEIANQGLALSGYERWDDRATPADDPND